jgi:ligand-binding sensor domain-containing protein/signal transduction histidine kinase
MTQHILWPMRRAGMTIIRLIILAILLSGAGSASAQDDIRRGFRRFTAGDGLSQGTVTSILQDHEGFIWVGTLDGLNRFDGIEFRTYRHIPGDTASLSSSWITSIHEDGGRRLWIGTLRGLNEFDRRTESFRGYSSAGPDGRATMDYPVSGLQSVQGSSPPGIIVSAQGIYLVNRTAGMLSRLDRPGPDGGVSVRIEEGEAATGRLWSSDEGNLYAIAPDGRRADRVIDIGESRVNTVLPVGGISSHELLVGLIDGLAVCDLRTGGTFRIAGVPPVRTIARNGDGRFWLATENGLWTLMRVEPAAGNAGGPARWESARAGLEGMVILSICRDSTGTLWVGSLDGLYRRQSAAPEFSVYRHREDNPNSLVSDFVMPIIEDRAGRIWFGTLDRGFSVLSPGGPEGPQFRNYPKGTAGRGGPPGNNIRSILQTRDGMVWMGTDGGLAVCDSGARFVGRYPNTGRTDSVGLWVDALLETRDGTLWAGASQARLVRVDRVRGHPPSFAVFHLIPWDENLPATGVNVIVEGAEGELWAGTESGLFRFDPRTGSVKRYGHDPAGSAGLSNSFVWSLSIESAGGDEILWVGTSQGLNRFDRATGGWKSYLRQEGFPSDWVYGIVPDGTGRLWLTTNHGISCFDDRKPEGSKFRNFDVTDGIAGNECDRRSFARLKGGDIIFGGTMGATRFHPLRLSDNRNVPPVVLTAVLNAGRKLPVDVDAAEPGQLRLRHDENDISFEFAALDYTNPLKNRYAYMMEGVDRDWIYIGNRRFVSYAGLDPGEYVFRVKASNNDGVWNEKGIAVGVLIAPPFWGTWWFRGIAFGLLALAVTGYVRDRKRRAMELVGVRRRIARDLHDEIGSNLTGIAVSGSLLKDSGELTPGQEARVADILSIAEKTSELMRDLIWVIRPENDRLDDLCFRMKDAAAGILGGSKCHFTMPDDAAAHTLNLEVKHNLYLIYKEIITNIARHAKAGEVATTLKISGRSLVLTVADDGIGFDTAKESAGMGLKNLSARASVVGGSIDITSESRVGTLISVTVPFT